MIVATVDTVRMQSTFSENCILIIKLPAEKQKTAEQTKALIVVQKALQIQMCWTNSELQISSELFP